jgi:hypothetical protein
MNMVTNSARPGTNNGSAGESQQWLTKRKTKIVCASNGMGNLAGQSCLKESE